MRSYAATQGRQEVEHKPGVTLQTASDVKANQSDNQELGQPCQMERVAFDNGVFKTSTSKRTQRNGTGLRVTISPYTETGGGGNQGGSLGPGEGHPHTERDYPSSDRPAQRLIGGPLCSMR